MPGMVDDLVERITLLGSDQLSAPAGAAAASLRGLGDKATETGGLVDVAFKAISDAAVSTAGHFDALGVAGAKGAGQLTGTINSAASSISGAAATIRGALDSAEASVVKLAASMEAATAKIDSGMAKAGASSSGLATKVSESDRVIEEQNLKAAESFKLIGDAAVAAGVKTGEAGAMMMKGPLGLILGVGLAVGETIHMADKMETTFAKIQGNTGMTTAQISKMRTETIQLGKQGPQSLDQIAAGFEHASNLQYRGADAMKIVTAGWKAAIATGGSTADTVNALGTVMHGFKIPVDQASATMGVLLAAAQNGNIHLPALAENFSKAGLLASAVHMPIADAAAVYSTLTQATGDAAQAQVLFSGMVSHVINPTKAAITVIGELHQKTGIDLLSDFHKFAAGQMSFHQVMDDARKATHGNASEIMTLFGGMRGGLGALKLINTGWGDYNAVSAKVHAGTTQLNDAFKNMMDTTGAKLETFKNKVEIGAIALGTKMLPAVGAVIDKLSAFSDWVGSKGSIIQGFFDKIGSVAGKVFSALTPGFTLLKNMVENDLVGAFNRLKPIFANVGSILETIGQKASEFSNNHGKALLAIFRGIGDAIGIVITAFSTIISTVLTFDTAIVKNLVNSKALGDVFGQLGTALQPVFTAIQQVVGSLGLFSKSTDDGGKSASAMAGIITNVLVGAISVLAKVIEAAVPTIVAAIRVIGDVITVVATIIKDLVPIVQDTWRLITDIFHGNGEKIHADLAAVWGKIKALFADLNPIVEKLENDLWVLVQKAFSAGTTIVLAKLSDFGNAFVAFIEGLPSRLGQGWMDITQKGTDALGQLATAGMAKLGEFAGRMTGWLADRAGDFGNASVAWIGGLVGGLGSQIGHLWSWYLDVTNRMTGWVTDRAGDMLNAGARFVTNLVSGLVSKIDDITGWLGSTATSIATWITTRAGDMLTGGASFVTSLVTGLVNKVGDLTGWYVAQATYITGWEKDRAADLLSAGASFVTSLVTGLVNKVGDLMGWFGSTKDKIATWISGRVTQFTNAAHAWVASMVTGLGDKIQSLMDEATKLATAVVTGIEHYFTSHNPFSGLVSQAKDAAGSITGFFGGIGNKVSGAVGGVLGGSSSTGGGNGPFGLSGVTGTVQSGAAGAAAEGEASLLGGRAPANDIDYLLPRGATQGVKLPGGKDAVYDLLKSSMGNNGIGGIEQFSGPSGGRFAFLHMSQVAQPGQYHGGDVVGKTGWPTNPIYGNGQAGPGNSQLCVVYDSSGNPMVMSTSQLAAAQAKGHGGGFGPALSGSRGNGSGAYPYDPYGGEHNLPGVRSDYAFSMPRGGERYAGGVQTDYNQAQRNQYLGGFIGTNTSAGALGALAAQSPKNKYGSFGAAQADTGHLSASIVKLTGSLDKLSPEVAKTMKAAIVGEAAQMQQYTSTYNANYAAENSRHVTAVAKIYHDNASQTVKQEGIYHAQIAANNQAAITSTAAAHEKFLKAQGKINDRFQTAQINAGTSLQTARNNADRAQTQALARLSQTEGKRQENSNSALAKANTTANEKFHENTKTENDRFNGILKDHGSATDAQMRAHTARLKTITDTHNDKLASNLEKHPVKMAVVTGTHITAFDRITQHHKNAFDNAIRAHTVSFDKATRQHTLQMGYLTQAHVKDYGAANQKLTDANNKWLSQHKTNLQTHLTGEGAGFDKHIAGLQKGFKDHLNGLSAANAALVAKMREALTDHALWDGLAAHLSNVIGKGTKDLAYQIYKGTADQSHRVVTPGVDGERATISWVANNTGMLNSMADAMRKQEKQTNALTQAQAEAAELVGDFGKALAYYTAKDAKSVTKTQDRYVYDATMGQGDPAADLAKYQKAYAKQQTDLGVQTQAKLATDRSVGIYSTSQSNDSKIDSTAVGEASAKLAYDFKYNSGMVALDTANLKEQTATQKANIESDNQSKLVGDRAMGVFGTSLTDLASKTSGPAKMAMDAFTWGLVTGTGDTKALAATMVSTAQSDKQASERTNQAHLQSDRLLGNFGTSLSDSQKKVSDAYTTASDKYLYDSQSISGASQQDVTDLLSSSAALKAHNDAVTASTDSQNRITGSYTSSVATFTAQINGPLTDANVKYAYDLHNHTGNLEADITAIQGATVGVKALGDEAQKVAIAGMGVYDGFVASAKAAYDHARAAFLDAQQSGLTGQALQDLYDKALTLGVAFDHAGDAATNFDAAVKTASDGIKQTAAQVKAAAAAGPNLYQWAAGSGPNAAMQGGGAGVGATGTGIVGSSGTNFASSTGLPLGTSMATAQAGTNYSGFAQSGLGYPTAPPNAGNNYNVPVTGTNTGTMPGGPTGTSGTITGVPYINGPSAPSGTVYYDPSTKLFVANGGWLSMDMLNNNASVNNGGGGAYQNPNLPVDAYTSTTNYTSPYTASGSLGPGGLPMDAWGKSSSGGPSNLGSASGNTTLGVLSSAISARYNGLRTQPIGGSTSGYVGPSSGAAGASPSNPVYVTPTNMSASQTTAMQAQLTQLQAQTAATQAASNAQIAALQTANATLQTQLDHAVQDTQTLKELQRQNTEALNLSTHNGAAYTSTAQLMDQAALQNRGAT